ncbi:MAG: cren protein [Desulfurococcales archaeon]|nr:cren protein [Desulfurococcales archaeon]
MAERERDAPEVPPAVVVRVRSLGDLVRLAASLAGRMIVMPVYRHPREGGGHVYYVQMMYRDYYKYYGLPIIYYYEDEGDDLPPDKAKYIVAKTDEAGERIQVTDRARTGWIVIPVINLEEPPSFFRRD